MLVRSLCSRIPLPLLFRSTPALVFHSAVRPAMQRSTGQRSRSLPLPMPLSEAAWWLRVGACTLVCVMLSVLALGIALGSSSDTTPTPRLTSLSSASAAALLPDAAAAHAAGVSSPATGKVRSGGPLSLAAREERESSAASNGPSGFAHSASEPRDRDISFLVLDDHAAFRRLFARMDELEAEAEADEYDEAQTSGDGKAPGSKAHEQAGLGEKLSVAVSAVTSTLSSGVGGKRPRRRASSPSNPGVRMQKLGAIWETLSLHLEIHADAEEKLLYPTLVRDGGKEAGAETKDAIGLSHVSNSQRRCVQLAPPHGIALAHGFDALLCSASTCPLLCLDALCSPLCLHCQAITTRSATRWSNRAPIPSARPTGGVA